MLKLDPKSKTLVPISSATLTQSAILERIHLQESIVRSWDAFIAELGYEELFLIGSEIEPHDSCRDRIDLLALSRDGTPVVFELKRHRDRLQLLQAISYAAMVAKWNADDFRKVLAGRVDEDADELRSLLAGEGFSLGDPEIVLIAESFDPEVILAAEWLAQFAVPITAFAIAGVEYQGDTLISIDQKFPLPGVDDLYVRRSVRAARGEGVSTWEDVLQDVSFSFANRAVEIFRRRIEGSPQRRSFFSIYAGSPLGRMRITLRRGYLKIYTYDQSQESKDALDRRLGQMIPVKPWGSESTKNSGFTFTIETEAQFDQFLKAVGETAG